MTERRISFWQVMAALKFCADDARCGIRHSLRETRRMTSRGFYPAHVALDTSSFGGGA